MSRRPHPAPWEGPDVGHQPSSMKRDRRKPVNRGFRHGQRSRDNWGLARLLDEVLQMRSELASLRSELLRLHSAQRQPESPTVALDEACQVLGCERTKLFELLKRGQLARADTPGRRVRISRDSLNAFLAGAQDVSAEARRLLARPRAGFRLKPSESHEA